MHFPKHSLRALALSLIASLGLVACGGGSSDDSGTAPVATTPPPTTPTPTPTPTTPTPVAPVAATAVSGRALDDSTGQGVAGVTVRVGTLSTVTAADGSFTLRGLAAAGRVPVIFESTTYAENTRVVGVVADTTTTDVQARLIPVGFSGTVPVAAGGVVSVPGSTAQVTLPANGVQRADGSTPTGNITVRVTPINPAADTTLMPGDFTAAVAGGTAPIESFGALDVTLSDDTGARLNLRSGQTASLRIPLRSRSAAAPATIPLFYFDTAAGLWREEGTATLVGTGAAAYYEGAVRHFTTWNADQIYNTVLVRGCLRDAAGNPVANARVFSDGIDYTGTSSAVSTAAGEFSLPIRRGSQAAINALLGNRLTNTVRNTASQNDITLPDCLALGQTGAGVTMKLTWGALPRDLDSHLVTPSGAHVYFSNKGSLTAEPFASLDVDDTSSFGPEVVTLTRLMVGTYKYYINNFSGFNNGPIATSEARVELNIQGQPVQLITPPATGEAASTNNWNVFEFDVSATCAITVRRVSNYSATEVTNPAGTPAYCTAPAS